MTMTSRLFSAKFLGGNRVPEALPFLCPRFPMRMVLLLMFVMMLLVCSSKHGTESTTSLMSWIGFKGLIQAQNQIEH